MVAVIKQTCAGLGFQIECQAVLCPLGAGLQPDFHCGFADRGRIAKLGLMLDRIVHVLCPQSLFDRVVDISLLHRHVNLVALLLNLFQLQAHTGFHHFSDVDEAQ